MQFSTVEIRFIVTTQLYSTFANDLKRKYFFWKMFIVTEYAALNCTNGYALILRNPVQALREWIFDEKFLAISLNIKFIWDLKELFDWEGSFEYPQEKFWLINKGRNF